MDSESTKNDAPTIPPTSKQEPSESNVNTSAKDTESSEINTSGNTEILDQNVNESPENSEAVHNNLDSDVGKSSELDCKPPSNVEDAFNQSITGKVEYPSEIHSSSVENQQNDTEMSDMDKTKEQTETERSNEGLEVTNSQADIISQAIIKSTSKTDVPTPEPVANEIPPVTTDNDSTSNASEKIVVFPTNTIPKREALKETSLDLNPQPTKETISDSVESDTKNLPSDIDKSSSKEPSSLDTDNVNAVEAEPGLVGESTSNMPIEQNLNRESSEKDVGNIVHNDENESCLTPLEKEHTDSTGNDDNRLYLESPEKEEIDRAENSERASCSNLTVEGKLGSLVNDKCKPSTVDTSEISSNSTEVADVPVVCSKETDTPVEVDQVTGFQNEVSDAMEVDKDNIDETEGEESLPKQTTDSTEVEFSGNSKAHESIAPDVQLTTSCIPDTQKEQDKPKGDEENNEKEQTPLDISSKSENTSKPNDSTEDITGVSESTAVSNELPTNAGDCQEGIKGDVVDKPIDQVPENISQNENITNSEEISSAENMENISQNENITNSEEISSAESMENISQNENITNSEEISSAENVENISQNENITNSEEISSAENVENISQNKNITNSEERSSGDKKDVGSDLDNQKLDRAEVLIKSEIEGSAEILKVSALSNDTGINNDDKDTEGGKKQDIIEPMDVDEIESSSKETIEPSAKANTSENSVDVAATEEALSKKNKGKDDENVIEKNIQLSGENKDGDLKNLPDSNEKITVEPLTNTNKIDDSKFSLALDSLNSVPKKSDLESITTSYDSSNSATNLTEEEDMPRKTKSKDSNLGSTKIDDTAIYEKFECKPLTVRADINIEELQKLKSVPEILGEALVSNAPEQEVKSKKSNEGDEKNDNEAVKTTRATAKPLDNANEPYVRPRKMIGPKRVKEKKHVDQIQKKIVEKAVDKPVEEDKPKIKCKKMDIQETSKDVREPSKRLIIKTQSSINESVQSTKKSTPLVQADVVDVEAVDDRYTKNPMRMYEVCKELRKMVRSQLSKKDKKAAELKKQYQLEEITPENMGTIDSSPKVCDNCKKMKPSTWKITEAIKSFLFCSMYCGIRFRLRRDHGPGQVKRRSCGACFKPVMPDDKSLTWKTINYCDEKCLTKAQYALGDVCGNCNSHLPLKLRGRYLLQRGNVREIFCSAMCRAYHKSAFKICTVCTKLCTDGAPITIVGDYKICSQECLKKLSLYKKTQRNMACCTVCHLNKPVQYVVLSPKDPVNHLCSEKCFKAFNFVNKLDVVSCNLCERYFDKFKHEDAVLSFFDDLMYNFCSKFCHYVYVSDSRSKTNCAWCKGEKNELSMIRRVYGDQEYFYCTLNCLNMLNVEKVVTAKSKQCDYCKSYSTDTFFISAYSATKSFCTYKCVYNFHNNIPFNTQVFKSPQSVQSNTMSKIVISDVRSLGASNAFPTPAIPPKPAPKIPIRPIQPSKIIKPKVEVTKILPRIIRQILVKPQEKKEMKNAATQVHPTTSNKRVSCKTTAVTKECQTGDDMGRPLLLPVPVPLYVPAPAAMYSVPFPVLVPVPIPIPVPVFIPTTRNSAAGIFKEIKRIQEKIPADPFEAELLMMAEMVASDKKDEGGTTDDDSNAADDDFDNEGGPGMEASSNAFGEDVLQMAIKMACNDLEPSGALQAVDLDDTLQAATIPITQPPPRPDNNTEDIDPNDPMYRGANRGGRKRGTSTKAPISRAPPIKRQRRTSDIIPPPVPTPAPPPPMEIEKPDANMCLKYTFGVNAWRQWVVQKNQELEKAATGGGTRKPNALKLFKPEILQLTADELNFSLCLFVQEVRKPNGTQYAPDTIYYLCLGIQQYLFESGRIDNIFTDPYYEKFTEALDEVCCKFSALYNDTQFIVTRVEEEHLWESKQLGAHSPHVLLNTLMFFNTKHFNLITVEEHMQLSFSHIMKHWKRNPGMAGSIATNCTKAPPGSRNVLLRFYPPQSAIDAPGSRKKKVYEQQENEENPLRCPVRLYEFYLSKCPESVKTRNDVFYLLPERSCVPDSPVWYSTSPLPKEALMKMLHRIKMVKEINIAFLSL